MLVNPTCVRVPVFYGHSEAVHIETRVKLSAADARALLSKAPGVQVLDERKNGGSNCGRRCCRTGSSLGRPHPRRHLASAWARSVDRFRQCPQGGCPEQCTNRGAFAKRTAISVTYCTLCTSLLSYLLFGFASAPSGAESLCRVMSHVSRAAPPWDVPALVINGRYRISDRRGSINRRTRLWLAGWHLVTS